MLIAPLLLLCLFFFFFHDTATTEIYTLSLHDALPICCGRGRPGRSSAVASDRRRQIAGRCVRSEEHTSELQSRVDLVCRLLLEKKKKKEELISRCHGRALSSASNACLITRTPDTIQTI